MLGLLTTHIRRCDAMSSSINGGLFTALNALRRTELRTVEAAHTIAKGGADALPEASTQLHLAKLEHKANAKVIRSLDQNLGQVLDIVA